MTVVPAEAHPVPSLFADVVGQTGAVAALRTAARQPVHAYLFVGPSGHGGMAAGVGFAAALLCPDGGCGECETCLAVEAGRHPDLHVVRRRGAMLSVEDAQRLVTLAQRRPLQAARQVVIVADVHLGERAAPALLKTLEEPPGQTVFVLLADQLIPDLATVASRCVRVDFPPVERAVVQAWLESRGVATDLATVIADSCGGSPGRAQLMVEDPEVSARAELWGTVPDALNGSGATTSDLVRQLIASTDRATEPLRLEHTRQVELLTAEAKEMGERTPCRGAKISSTNTSARSGAGAPMRCAPAWALARVYRSRASGAGRPAIEAGAAVSAVGLITEAAQALPNNPNEALLLQSLLVKLGSLGA